MSRKLSMNEDILPQKIPLIYSARIRREIKDAMDANQNNQEGLSKWKEYVDGITDYVSNRSIAFDYRNAYPHFQNGATFINDFGYNVGFNFIEDSTTGQLMIFVFMVNLNLEEFGLKEPQNEQNNNMEKLIHMERKHQINEARLKRIVSESISRHIGKPMRITESDIRQMVMEAINEISPELLGRASDKAYDAGREKQGAKFQQGASERLKEELPFFDYADQRVCTYKNDDGNLARITNYRKIFVNGCWQDLDFSIPSEAKVSNRSLAKNIAKWCSRFIDKQGCSSEVMDWHNWCRL